MPDILTKKILIIDDEPDSIAVIKGFLESLESDKIKFLIEEVYDGSESLAKIKFTPYDLIICDLKMPVLDGHGVIEYIKKQETPNLKTPILMLTAYAKDLDIDLNDHNILLYEKPIERSRFNNAICIIFKIKR